MADESAPSKSEKPEGTADSPKAKADTDQLIFEWELLIKRLASNPSLIPFHLIQELRDKVIHDLEIIKKQQDEIEEREKAQRALYDYFEQQLAEVREREEEAQLVIQTQRALDDLTRLLQRTAFEKSVREWIQFERRQTPVALTIFDINDLKKVNDCIGHQMGSLMIQRAAKMIKDGTRSKPTSVQSTRQPDRRKSFSDLKARLGGDEFGTLTVLEHYGLGEPFEEMALRIVNRICADFHAVDWAGEYQEWKPKTSEYEERVRALKPAIAAGVAVIHMGELPRIYTGASKRVFEKIFTIADALMYKSKAYEKEHGRRRIFHSVLKFENRTLKTVQEEVFYDPPATA